MDIHNLAAAISEKTILSQIQKPSNDQLGLEELLTDHSRADYQLLLTKIASFNRLVDETIENRTSLEYLQDGIRLKQTKAGLYSSTILYSRGAQSVAHGPFVALEWFKNNPRGHPNIDKHTIISRIK